MIKPYLKHRTFETIRMPTGLEHPALERVIEADEAYIQVVTPGILLSVTRSRDRDLYKALEAAGVSPEERLPFRGAYLSVDMGAVNVNTLISADYSAYHPPVRQDMFSRLDDQNPFCGCRDRLTLAYGDHNADQEDFVLVIETVHYVPADAIGI
jgi:hypothetical protein